MKAFDLNKKYIFDKDIALQDKTLALYYNSSVISRLWVKECNKKEVVIVNKTNGRIKVRNTTYSIVPEWCKEVE